MDGLQGWIGREEVAEDEASLVLLRRLAALLDQDPGDIRRNGWVPQGWHVAFFGPLTRQSGLGPDGHAALGEFLPPVPLPRRMFAGQKPEDTPCATSPAAACCTPPCSPPW